jgi:hypothetical protein
MFLPIKIPETYRGENVTDVTHFLESSYYIILFILQNS